MTKDYWVVKNSWSTPKKLAIVGQTVILLHPLW